MESQSLIQQTETSRDSIRSSAFIVSVVICVLFSLAFVASGVARFGCGGEVSGIELDEKINPNQAPAASLARLPNIGFVRAEAIVAYREQFKEQNIGSPAFRNPDDLQKIRGIGPKTAQSISQWLRFEFQQESSLESKPTSVRK